jgi:2,5-diketo-D-gluconate reductase A
VTFIPDITLNNGQAIPQFGFGVFLIDPKDTVAAVSTALQAGYRHIDTAEMYGNEAEVGEAIARSGLDRGEVFVTSKLGNDAHEPGNARQAFDETLKALGTEYVDLFLIHWPLPARYGGDFVQTWRVLEEAYRQVWPGPSASPTSSPATCGGCTARPRSSRPSTRSRSTRT